MLFYINRELKDNHWLGKYLLEACYVHKCTLYFYIVHYFGGFCHFVNNVHFLVWIVHITSHKMSKLCNLIG